MRWYGNSLDLLKSFFVRTLVWWRSILPVFVFSVYGVAEEGQVKEGQSPTTSVQVGTTAPPRAANSSSTTLIGTCEKQLEPFDFAQRLSQFGIHTPKEAAPLQNPSQKSSRDGNASGPRLERSSTEANRALKDLCTQAKQLPSCVSVEGVPIFHVEREPEKLKAGQKAGKRILVFSLIHGDEVDAGAIGRLWAERVISLQNPRNAWRIVPVLNPDGLKQKTRTNKNGIDLNRNFPTKKWEDQALKNWEKETKSNPRRFPGKKAGSEPEVTCAIQHIEEFRPDLIVSVHTPLKVLDFDGPKKRPLPKYSYLPWKKLGTMPGSLGRYMGVERNIPVLTLELKDKLPHSLAPFEELQDLLGNIVVKQSDTELSDDSNDS